MAARLSLTHETMDLQIGQKWFEITVDPILDSAGQFSGAVHIISDITERKQSEAEIRESEERFRAIFERSTVGKSLTAPDGKPLRVNKAFADMLGYPVEELQLLDLAQITHPDDMAKSLEIIRALMSGEQSDYRLEKRYIHKSGRIVWAEVSTTLFRNEQGAPLHMITSIVDVTERKRTEEALRKSEQKYRMVADFTYDWEYWMSPDQRFLYCSPSCERVTGYRADEFEKDPGLLKRIIHPDDREQFDCHLTGEGGSDQMSHSQEFRIFSRSGEMRWIVHICISVHGREGEYLGQRASNRDITVRVRTNEERAKLESQLQQAQKMEAIGTLAGGIAHDFNNILSAVIGYTELAQMKLEADSRIQNDLKGVLAASVRAKDLVNQILSFSRQTQKEQTPVQMRLIVKEALKLIRSSLPVTIDIRQDIQSQSLVLSDPTRLHQIVMNLCTNAAHAMRKKGGILEVILTDVELNADFCSTRAEIQPGAYQKLTVSDTGHGITADVMNQIFDPFFTTKPKNEGTGLGLSVVHGIVKDSGGTITVNSEPDRGTTFHLYLPVIKSSAEESPEEHTILATGTERILVVDDEKVLTDILNKNLSSLGYTVEARTNSLEALALFKAMPDQFDLVITDMTMPQLTGVKLAQELMKIRPDLPVILCTGFSENITKKKAKAMGIKAFLLKPLLKKEMAHKIRKVLDEANDAKMAEKSILLLT